MQKRVSYSLPIRLISKIIGQGLLDSLSLLHTYIVEFQIFHDRIVTSCLGQQPLCHDLLQEFKMFVKYSMYSISFFLCRDSKKNRCQRILTFLLLKMIRGQKDRHIFRYVGRNEEIN